MDTTQFRPWAARTLVILMAVVALGINALRPARGDETSIGDAPAPIVRIALRTGDVTIRTWDRAEVGVSADPAIAVERRIVRPEGGGTPILIPQIRANSMHGELQLPPESFVASTFPAGARTLVIVRQAPGTAVAPPGPVTVNVPADSVAIFARTGKGNIDVRGYRGGTFVGFVGRGRLALADIGGTVFAQNNHGPVTIVDSTLDRVRARSLSGNMAFERCNVHQIEATSVAGSIVFDGGTFAPGLARFESTSGEVAIGTAAAANLSGRATNGRVYTNFSGKARVDARTGEANATVGGGGPLVAATSESGSVYLYDGTLHARGGLPSQWKEPADILARPQSKIQSNAPQSHTPQFRAPRSFAPHHVPAPLRFPASLQPAPSRLRAEIFAAPRHRASRYAEAGSPRVYSHTLRRTFAPASRRPSRA